MLISKVADKKDFLSIYNQQNINNKI